MYERKLYCYIKMLSECFIVNGYSNVIKKKKIKVLMMKKKRKKRGR